MTIVHSRYEFFQKICVPQNAHVPRLPWHDQSSLWSQFTCSDLIWQSFVACLWVFTFSQLINNKMATSCICLVTKFYSCCPLSILGFNPSSTTTDLFQILILQHLDCFKSLLQHFLASSPLIARATLLKFKSIYVVPSLYSVNGCSLPKGLAQLFNMC